MSKRTSGFAAVVSILGIAALAHAIDGVIEINQPTALAGSVTPSDSPGFPVTLDSAGSYKLTSNLSLPDANTTAIEVTADFVTIDLNGFSILGTGASGTGDGIRSFANRTTVRNGSVSGVGADGLNLGDSARVDGVIAAENGGTGIRIGASGLVSGSISSLNTEFGLSLGEGSGYSGNSLTENHGGAGYPQVSGDGVQLGENLCGVDLTCDVCGDAVVIPPEACDDGNTDSGDGCDPSCQFEPGYACGDGGIAGGETCDDGGTAPGDGCDATCQVEAGWDCVGEPSTCAGVCGDNLIRGAETCDDGGFATGDGCDDFCAIEPGSWCVGEPSNCFDGSKIFVTSQASDGNLGGLSGADAQCNSLASAAGLSGSYLAWLSDGITAPIDRMPQSGSPYRRMDGIEIAADWATLTTSGAQQLVNLDENGVGLGAVYVWSNVAITGTTAGSAHCLGWTSTGSSGYYGYTGTGGSGWTLSGSPTACTNPTLHLYCVETFTCGDSQITPGEACDDGNTDPNDGCSEDCAIEHGWVCDAEPSVCQETCGDALVSFNEQCDDGGTAPGDGCDAFCATEPGYSCFGDPSNCFEGAKIFVTSQASNGILGGLSGADSQCNSLASAAGLSGAYLSWLSDGITAPIDRLEQSTLPYRRVDGTQIAADWATLTTIGAQAPVLLDENGVSTSSAVWSNVTIAGTSVGADHCSGWTSTAGGGEFGYSHQGGVGWTNFNATACTTGGIRLYCVETFTCGDSQLTSGEACDDGNTNPSDGCAADCSIELGWECSGSPSVCTVIP